MIDPFDHLICHILRRTHITARRFAQLRLCASIHAVSTVIVEGAVTAILLYSDTSSSGSSAKTRTAVSTWEFLYCPVGLIPRTIGTHFFAFSCLLRMVPAIDLFRVPQSNSSKKLSTDCSSLLFAEEAVSFHRVQKSEISSKVH